MARKNSKWSDKKLERYLKEKRGEGEKAEYIPWIKIKDFSSLGRGHRIKDIKTERVHHFFSDLEADYYYHLIWNDEIIDIREQFPLLPQDSTEEIAMELGVKHPEFYGVNVVMTTDFLLTINEEHPKYVARSVKFQAELENQRTKDKLSIESKYWLKQDIEHKVVTENSFSRERAKNIKFLLGYYDFDRVNILKKIHTRSSQEFKKSIYVNRNFKLNELCKRWDEDSGEDDEMVWDINREKAMMAPQRISLVTKYILDRFDQKTYRGDKTYIFNTLSNISEVASAERGAVEEIKQKQRISGFNSIFAVASVPMAKLYYEEFQKQMKEQPAKKLRVAIIFSYGANEEEVDGILDEENLEDTSALDQNSRDFLESAIRDYNEMFHTSYDTSSDKFQNYYKDVSLRMKNKELDLLIVVNMFLTGFDATTLNTLWVDKNLKMHGLLQAFSRTNRILNSIKTFGNIVCFRNLQKRVDSAISLFGDKNAGGIVLMKSFKDYYYGFESIDGNEMPGYVDLVEELKEKFPLSEPQIIGEKNQKEFIALFGTILRMRNLLVSFDEFKELELLSERDLQDYLGRYQDLRDEWKQKREAGESTDIIDDIVFEIELIKQIEINIDYILMLVKKYHDTHCEDKEILISITKAIDASPELRSKKQLIENFIAGINDVDDVMAEWHDYVVYQRENDLLAIIMEEKLKPEETRKFIENAFRDGEIKTAGTDIDKIMPPVSRFGGGGRAEKKQGVIDKLKVFFEKYFGVGGLSSFAENEDANGITYEAVVDEMQVAEDAHKCSE